MVRNARFTRNPNFAPNDYSHRSIYTGELEENINFFSIYNVKVTIAFFLQIYELRKDVHMENGDNKTKKT